MLTSEGVLTHPNALNSPHLLLHHTKTVNVGCIIFCHFLQDVWTERRLLSIIRPTKTIRPQNGGLAFNGTQLPRPPYFPTMPTTTLENIEHYNDVPNPDRNRVVVNVPQY